MSSNGWYLESDESEEYVRLEQLRYQIETAAAHLDDCSIEDIFDLIKTNIFYPQSIIAVPTNFSEYEDDFIKDEIRKQINVSPEMPETVDGGSDAFSVNPAVIAGLVTAEAGLAVAIPLVIYLYFKSKLKKIAETMNCEKCKTSLSSGKVKNISYSNDPVRAYIVCSHCKHKNMVEMAKSKGR